MNRFVLIALLLFSTRSQQLQEIYDELESLENFGKRINYYKARYTGDTQKLEYQASLLQEREQVFQNKLRNLTNEYKIQQAEKQKQMDTKEEKENLKREKPQKRYWQMDPGTDIGKHQENLQKKFEDYRKYVKEVESQFGQINDDDDDVELAPEEIEFYLYDLENIHKLKGKRRKLVTEAQREDNQAKNTAGMTQGQIDAMTETELKKMKGIYEQDSKQWQRTYHFDDWQVVFLALEEENILCRGLMKCVESLSLYQSNDICNIPEHLTWTFGQICNYDKLEDLGYWSARYEFMLEDINFYFHKQLENYAHIDKYMYPALIGTEFETPEIRAQYFYMHNKPAGYKVDFPSPKWFRIYIRIDPCATKSSAVCCQESAQDVCEDHLTIISGKDVPIAWFFGGFVVQCSEQYSKRGQCGTYIEIHRPNNPKVEEAVQIHKPYNNGFNTQYISTKNLCTGRYEFWIVVRTRNGSILQHVKPFFSKYPTCRFYNIDKKYQVNYATNQIFAREKRVFEIVDDDNDYLITQEEIDLFLAMGENRDIVLDADLDLFRQILAENGDGFVPYDKFAINPNKH